MATRTQQNEAIRELRRRVTGTNQRRVARAIIGKQEGVFGFDKNLKLIADNNLRSRSFYSVYHVIRKHDALERQKAESSVYPNPFHQL